MAHDMTITTDNDNAASGTTKHDVQRLMLALTRLLTGARGTRTGPRSTPR